MGKRLLDLTGAGPSATLTVTENLQDIVNGMLANSFDSVMFYIAMVQLL